MVLIDNSTVRLDATFIEPDKNADGTTLTDLARCTIYVKIGAGAPASVATINASKPAGGGTMATTILVPASNGAKTSLTAWVTATDLSGNESAASTSVMFVIDRIGPDVPVTFTLG